MKKNLKLIISAIIVIIIAVGGYFGFRHHQENEVQEIETVKVKSTEIPTFFFHGWGSSYHAEENMVEAIKHAGVTKNVIRTNVTANGTVILHGKLSKHAKNPIVMVNFDDNKLKNYRDDYTRGYNEAGSRYVNNVLHAVTKKYGYKQVNIVAHSMGNLETAYWFKRYNNIPVAHFISIAGHYDGIVGMNDKPNKAKIDSKTGKPSRMMPEYKGLLSLRKTFPNKTRVLNIFGNLEDGSNSDGDVSVASARSLRYLLNGRAKSYREKMICGKAAQHSHLHNNREVNQAIVDFLWQK